MAKLSTRTIERARYERTGPADFTTLSDGLGLELRIWQSGAKSWVVRFQFGGKRKVVTIGVWPTMSLADARMIAADTRGMVREGVDPMTRLRSIKQAKDASIEADAEAKAQFLCLTDAVERWAGIVLLKRKTGMDSLRALRKNIIGVIDPKKEKDVRDVTRRDLLEALDQVVARGAPRMANRLLGDAKQFFSWAHDREIVDNNPLMNISKERVGGPESERDRVLLDKEIVELSKLVPTSGLEPRMQDSIWVILSTMCRVGELIKAEWKHIDFEERTWVIPKENAKNGRMHRIYLSDFSLAYFHLLHEKTGWSEWVLPSGVKAGHHMEEKGVTRKVRDRQRETPLNGRAKDSKTLLLSEGTWTPHDLRRTGATIMARMGVLPDIVDRTLNHVETNRMKRTYQVYDYWDEQVTAWAKLSDHLIQLIRD